MNRERSRNKNGAYRKRNTMNDIIEYIKPMSNKELEAIAHDSTFSMLEADRLRQLKSVGQDNNYFYKQLFKKLKRITEPKEFDDEGDT